jgi:FKBP-type peptidyl-prolyl cis-trans isomerase
MFAIRKEGRIRLAGTGLTLLLMVSCSTLKREQTAPALPAPQTFRTNGMEEHLSSARAASGRIFLAKNAMKPGVVERPSGLQFLVIKEGTGPLPRAGDIVVVRYKLFNTKGDLIDDSLESGGPVRLEVDKVIAGWREALQEMRVGSIWMLFLPAELAYGREGLANIPGGETLVYEITLLGIDPGLQDSGEAGRGAAVLPGSRVRAPATGSAVRDNLELID